MSLLAEGVGNVTMSSFTSTSRTVPQLPPGIESWSEPNARYRCKA
jgi:hypothetical protein